MKMKNILYTIILLLLSENLFADATQGEMFGFKLGDKYPLTERESEALKSTWVSEMEQEQVNPYYYTGSTFMLDSLYGGLDAKKPKNYGGIFVDVTQISHTIVRITSITCFLDLEKSIEDIKERADSFYKKQKKILYVLYPSESNIYIDERDRRSATKKEYTLTINKDKRVCVQTVLEPFSDTGIGHHLNKLEQEEHKEFILQRLDIEGL